jgi:hypothetical protein
MNDLEIPVGKRTKSYRFFEMVPAIISYGSIILLIVLSILSPFLAAAYLLAIIITMLIKAIGIAYHTTKGRNSLESAQRINWHERLTQLENPSNYIGGSDNAHHGFGYRTHQMNLQDIASQVDLYPKASEIYNAAIIATYKESYDILQPTIQSLLNSSYDKSHLIVVIAYEERGGDATSETVHRLKEEFGNNFKAFLLVKHPPDLPNEVIGKGGNITNAGRYLQQWLNKNNIKYNDVIITTLDADNRVHHTYLTI